MRSNILQAREIIRSARRQNIKPTHYDSKKCIVAVIAGELFGKALYTPNEVAQTLNKDFSDILALESGFEGYDNNKNNRYYKVGQKVAELAGLSSKD